jgi:putative RecB family exonuclease
MGMRIEHISVSRASLFKECPYKYKLKYHDKVPYPGPEPFYFVYGKVVHKIAETYVEERGQRSLAEITSDVLNGRIEIEPGKKAPPLPADYARRLPGHIRSIQKLTDRIGTNGILEHNFKYDLDPPHGRLVTGFIDRIIVHNDKIWILDYKTTKKGPFRSTIETIKKDPQLRLYARVVQKEHGVPASHIKCALYYVEGGDLIPAVFSDEDLVDVEAYLLDIYKTIETTEPEEARGRTGQHCTRCEYKDMCPYFGSSRSDVWDGDLTNIIAG